MAEETVKTEAQLSQEVADLVREIGTRNYTRFLVDREIAQLQGRLYEANVELYNRRQLRAAIEAEKVAAGDPSATVIAPEPPPEYPVTTPAEVRSSRSVSNE